MIQFQCPKCGQALELDDDFQEPEVHCNLCGAEFPFVASPVDRWSERFDAPASEWPPKDPADSTGAAAPPSRAAEPVLVVPPAPPRPNVSHVSQPASPPTVPRGDRPLVLGMTGASGAPYAIRLLQVLAQAGRQVHLVISSAAAQVLRDEMDIDVDPDRFDTNAFLDVILNRSSGVASGAPLSVLRSPPSALLHYHHHTDWSAGIASGSFLTDGMVICPCSMSTLGAIAGGLSTNLIQRAADVHLKERRKLILVPRETPLNLIQLENMTQCVRAGAVVLPAMPGWYDRPQSLDDLVNFVVGRICDQLGVSHDLFRRWGADAISR